MSANFILTMFNNLTLDLMRFRKVPEEETVDFRSLMHNNDLVPHFTEKLDSVVSFFKSFNNAAYDIQGIRDRGVDVIIDIEDAETGEGGIIGIQLKSFKDLEKKDYLQTIKSQLFEAYSQRNVSFMYLVLCTDEKKHKDKIRYINSDAIGIKGMKVYVIQPRQALGFYNASELELYARTKRQLMPNDELIHLSDKLFNRLSIYEASILIEAVVQYISNSTKRHSPHDLIGNPFVQDVYQRYGIDGLQLNSDEFKTYKSIEHIADAHNVGPISLGNLSAESFFIESMGEEYSFNPSSCAEVIAVLYDIYARHNNDEYGISEYALSFFLEERIQELAELINIEFKRVI